MNWYALMGAIEDHVFILKELRLILRNNFRRPRGYKVFFTLFYGGFVRRYLVG
jgi:hypothetical protein